MRQMSKNPEKCILCGRKSGDFKIEGDFVYGGSKTQKFYSCPECDVAFLYPGMSENQEKRFYAKEFERFMEKRSGDDFDWSGPEAHIKSNEKQYLRRLEFFSDLISSGKSLLEIGCSSGFMLLPLKEKGMDVVGIESSAGFGNFLKGRGVAVFDSLDALRKSRSKDKKFDLVMHFFVMEHVRQPLVFLKEALELVAKDGKMIFEVPNRADPLISIYNIPAFQKFYWSVAHHYYFNRRSLEYVLKPLGVKYEIFNEQRYDISNHMTWALEGRPGGQGRFSAFFTPELKKAYMDSMLKTGYCDTLVVRVHK
jgi:SAM-dependent methyltransferase